jgi:PAS domain S-box-containing protein
MERPPQTAAATDRLLAAVIDSSPAGMIVSDREDRLVAVNPSAARLLGVQLGGDLGRPMADVLSERVKWRLVNPEDSARAVTLTRAGADPRRACGLETVDGRALRLRTCRIRSPSDGSALGRLDTIMDVSEARDALERARRLADEREHLLEAEELRAQQEAALARAGQLLSSALTPADVHALLADRAMALVRHCDKVAVLAADRRGVVRVVVHEGFTPETVGRMVFRPDQGGVVPMVMAGGRPFICNDTAAEPRGTSAITGPEGIRSYMHVPIVVGERVHGIVVVNSTRPRAFGERELHLVTDLARHAASALQNALRYAQERHVANTLQRALGAPAPPDLPGLEIAARYRPTHGVQVGGDICAIWEAPGSGAAALIGDVSGRGIEAAGLAVMVRHMAEALGRHHADPGALMTELNDLLHTRMPADALVTLAMVIADPRRGSLRWANAGHPAPVMLGRDGRITTLGEPGPPCGAFPGRTYPEHVAPFGPGDLIVLYTDGLTEARRGGTEFGEHALHRMLGAHAHRPVGELPGAVLDAVERWCEGSLDDDVALAAIRARDEPGTG